MKRVKYIMYLGILLALLAGCNETLEDTYSDYAGDGKIRYVGKCSEMLVKPGWRRLKVDWVNSMDIMVDKIKVSWEADGMKHDTLLTSDMTSCDIRNLADNTYRIDVCAIDKNGNESLPITDYARPYSYEHEAVRSFSRIISKHYFIDNNLVFFIDNWNDSIVEAKLCYTDIYNKKKEHLLVKEEAQQGLIHLEGVNTKEPIIVTRNGKLEGCTDLITFADYSLTNERIYSSDFKVVLQQRYGLKNENEEQKLLFDRFVDTVTVLEFDYDLVSFEDLFYCSNLKKIVCGKNRYLSGLNPNSVDISTLDNETRSLECLDLLNKVRGLQVDQYNEHYFNISRPYINKKGNPTLPNLNYIQGDDIVSIKDLSVKGDSEDAQELVNLLDNNPDTWWEPSVATSPRTHEILITLKEVQVIKGIKVVQRLYRPTSSSQKYYVSDKITIEVSSDNVSWTPMCYMRENMLGIGSGESTLIPMAEPHAVKYIKATLSDRMHNSSLNFNMTLSGLIPYK